MIGQQTGDDLIVLVFALQLFVQLKKEQEGSGPARAGVQTFTSIKELARRFSLTFGDKYRECLVMIHRSVLIQSARDIIFPTM